MDLADLGLEDNKQKQNIIPRTVLREQIKENLINRIQRREFAPGDRIIETRLAKELGVSQGAVRESLRELEWMGFLESAPYSGTYVKEITLQDLRSLYPVRATLESLAGRLAICHLTDEMLDALKGLVDDMVQVSEQGDVDGMVERNFIFHRAIVLATQNEFLIHAWSMFQFSYWTSFSTAQFDNLVYLAKRHYSVLEALRSGDPDQAAQALQNHIEELLELIDQRQAMLATETDSAHDKRKDAEDSEATV